MACIRIKHFAMERMITHWINHSGLAASFINIEGRGFSIPGSKFSTESMHAK